MIGASTILLYFLVLSTRLRVIKSQTSKQKLPEVSKDLVAEGIYAPQAELMSRNMNLIPHKILNFLTSIIAKDLI